MRPTPDKMSAFLAQLKKKMNLKSLVVTLAAIVVFTTTYLLILPAFTLDKEEAMEQGGIDVVAVETAADADQDEEAAEDVEDEVASEESAAPETETVQTEQAIQADDSDKAEAAAKPDVKLLTKQKTITAERAKDDDFEVSVVVGKDAKVPDDVTITATELNKETEDFDYDKYKENALEALKKDSSDVKGIKSIKFYDISLESESQDDAVKPEAPVNVKIAYEDGIKVDDKDNVRIVHFAEQENDEIKAEVLDAKENNVEATVDNMESKLTEASFETDRFSVYAIAETEVINEEVFIVNDNNTEEGSLKVTLLLDEKTELPDNAIVEVDEIGFEDPEWNARSVQLAAALFDKYGNVTISDARFLSLRIMVDDQEYKLEAPAEVKVEFTDTLFTEDTAEYNYCDEEGRELRPDPEEQVSHFAVINYTEEGPKFLVSDKNKGVEIEKIESSTFKAESISNLDIVYVYEYTAPRQKK